jgi:hypothetical protein
MNISTPPGQCKPEPALRRLFEVWCAASFEEREQFDWFIQSLYDNDNNRNLLFDDLLAAFPGPAHCGGQVIIESNGFVEHQSPTGNIWRSPKLSREQVKIFAAMLAQFTASDRSVRDVEVRAGMRGTR